MKKDLTEIIFIVDRSGSMASIRKDMIGGFNTFLKEQKKLPTECKVSFYQFDSNYRQTNCLETIYEQRLLGDVPELTEETFVPRGGTPLYDAVAKAIRRTEERLANLAGGDRPEKVLIVCITDGEENESREWKAEQVKQMIENKEEKFKWEFVYLGANQDAWAVSNAMGVKASSTLGYIASPGGTDSMWKSLSDKTMKYRSAVDVSKGVSFDGNDLADQVSQGYKI